MVNTGFSALDGSWKMVAIEAPRICRSRFASAPRMFSPSSSTLPLTRALAGSSPRIDIAVTLLPEPDSPTSASTWPRRRSKSIP